MLLASAVLIKHLIAFMVQGSFWKNIWNLSFKAPIQRDYSTNTFWSKRFLAHNLKLSPFPSFDRFWLISSINHSVSFSSTHNINNAFRSSFLQVLLLFFYSFLANQQLEMSAPDNTWCVEVKCIAASIFFWVYFNTLMMQGQIRGTHTLKSSGEQNSSDNTTFSRIFSKSLYSRKQKHH